jgi:hypothetical protein
VFFARLGSHRWQSPSEFGQQFPAAITRESDHKNFIRKEYFLKEALMINYSITNVRRWREKSLGHASQTGEMVELFEERPLKLSSATPFRRVIVL